MAFSLGKSLKNLLPSKIAPTDSDTLWTTPWDWRDEEGTYIGHNGQVWLYRALPVQPLQWEDGHERLRLGDAISTLLVNLGSTSSTPLGALRTLSNNREIHFISVTWEEETAAPEGTPPKLSEYLNETLGFTAPKRALLIGVRLRSNKKSNQNSSMINQLATTATKILAEDVPDRGAYEQDRQLVSNMIARIGGRKMKPEEQAQLESWYNLGQGPDVTIVEESTNLRIANFDTMEMSAVMRFANPVMSAPYSQWVLDALTLPGAPRLVSIRAELEPAAVARARARRSQRRVQASIEEEQATGDLERVELSSTFQQAQELETFLASGNEPLLTNCSIIMARSLRDGTETYMDWLRDNYQIEMKPLEHRQLPALDETLPASSRRVNPFLQDVSVSLLAYAGLNGFDAIGDSKGCFLGLSDSDGTPVFLNPLGASAENKPPVMLVAGEPGSGKTFTSQSIATQSVLAGLNCIFINPKGFDSLSPFADFVEKHGVPSTIIKMSAMEKSPGAFDPFLYCPPLIAAEVATQHILSVLDFGQDGNLELGQALKRAAQGGARCVGDAFQYMTNPAIVRSITQQVEASSLFALGIALEPRRSFDKARGLTLIEFDRDLGLPAPSKTASEHTPTERIALSAIRLITRAAMEILMGSGGGLMIVDEAWTFLGHEAGKSALERLAREGRSLNVLAIFATQKVSDVLNEGLEAYITRVLVMQMRDEKEIRAALTLCGLEATKARIDWVKDLAYKKADPENDLGEIPARALHRDLRDRHTAILLGPTPADAMLAFSTNPEDREKRRQAELATSEQYQSELVS